jgi:hypothetical protein
MGSGGHVNPIVARQLRESGAPGKQINPASSLVRRLRPLDALCRCLRIGRAFVFASKNFIVDFCLTQLYLGVKSFVKHKYEKENREANDWHAACHGLFCGPIHTARSGKDRRRNKAITPDQIRLDKEKLAFLFQCSK